MESEQKNQLESDKPLIEETENEIESDGESANCKPFSESWINRHHKAIMAWSAIGGFITTLVLAIFAGLSLQKVKQQNDLAFKQFVIANHPSVRVYAEKGFEFDDSKAWMQWMAVNKGGYVQSLEFKSILLCCGLNEIFDQASARVIVRTHMSGQLKKDEIKTVRHTVYDQDQISWIKSVFKDESKEKKAVLYIQAKFNIPPELSLSGKSKSDTSYATLLWVSHTKSFENLPASYERKILNLINERGYLEQE